jgi:hypothetical protein
VLVQVDGQRSDENSVGRFSYVAPVVVSSTPAATAGGLTTITGFNFGPLGPVYEVRIRLIPRWVTLIPRWVTLIPRWVTLIPRWVTLIPRWVTLIPRWVTLIPRWVTLTSQVEVAGEPCTEASVAVADIAIECTVAAGTGKDRDVFVRIANSSATAHSADTGVDKFRYLVRQILLSFKGPLKRNAMKFLWISRTLLRLCGGRAGTRDHQREPAHRQERRHHHRGRAQLRRRAEHLPPGHRLARDAGWRGCGRVELGGVHHAARAPSVPRAGVCKLNASYMGAISGKLRERVVNYDTLSPSCKPHSTNTGLGPLAV